MSSIEVGAVRVGGKFGRPDKAGTGIWAENGWHGIVFDKESPDGELYAWELSGPGGPFGRHLIRHPRTAGTFGGDSTNNGAKLIVDQFYLKPDSAGEPGILESPTLILDPVTKKLVIAYFSCDENGEAGPAFRWVKL
jgi:hypothetical protein